MSEHDCGHDCCVTRHDPNHDHFLTPEQCTACPMARVMRYGAARRHSQEDTES